MITIWAVLLLAIAGANAACNDGGRVACYVNLYRNTQVFNKETLCAQLPITQQCVNATGCSMDQLDDYLESLIKSCKTPCDLFKSMECSKEFKRPTKNMTFCQALKEIKSCYSKNLCENVMKENPGFFRMCDENETQQDDRPSWKKGRLGKIFKNVKSVLTNEVPQVPVQVPTGSQPMTTELPTTSPTLTTELPTGGPTQTTEVNRKSTGSQPMTTELPTTSPALTTEQPTESPQITPEQPTGSSMASTK